MKRASNIAPNTLWDKTAYSLGVTNGSSHRTAREHAAFVAHQRALLANAVDPGLVAFLRFLDAWRFERWPELGFSSDAFDKNVVFGLEAERHANAYLHDRPAARLHPSIKGV